MEQSYITPEGKQTVNKKCCCGTNAGTLCYQTRMLTCTLAANVCSNTDACLNLHTCSQVHLAGTHTCSWIELIAVAYTFCSISIWRRHALQVQYYPPIFLASWDFAPSSSVVDENVQRWGCTSDPPSHRPQAAAAPCGWTSTFPLCHHCCVTGTLAAARTPDMRSGPAAPVPRTRSWQLC